MKYHLIIVVEDPGIQIYDSICLFREELMLGLEGVVSGIKVFFSFSLQRKPWSAENDDDDRV